MNQVTYLKQREGETIPELAKRIAEAHQAMRTKQPEIISRAEAKERGLKYYFTGNPCGRGEVAARKTNDSSCLCVKCREAARDRRRKCEKRNPKLKAERSKRYRRNKPDKIKERNKRYYQENKENISAYKSEYVKNNAEMIKEHNRNYYTSNKERFMVSGAKRRSAKLQSIPLWFSEFDHFVIQQAYELSSLRKHETGIEWHVDHLVPLQARDASGLHCANNIQVIPAAMNLAKKNRMILTEPLEWLR